MVGIIGFFRGQRLGSAFKASKRIFTGTEEIIDRSTGEARNSDPASVRDQDASSFQALHDGCDRGSGKLCTSAGAWPIAPRTIQIRADSSKNGS